MVWRVDNFQCKDCDFVFEELYEDILEVFCLMCKSTDIEKQLSMPNLGSFSMMSPEMQRDSLMKRSAKHTQSEVDKTPEKWGAEGIKRATKKIRNKK